MIDIEYKVMNAIREGLDEADYEHVAVIPEYIDEAPSYPCVSVRESNSSTLMASVSGFNEENHDEKMYTIELFTNNKSGSKLTAKKIYKIIDETMLSIGFSRTFLEAIPNFLDATIYRMTGRYVGVVDKDLKIHRR